MLSENDFFSLHSRPLDVLWFEGFQIFLKKFSLCKGKAFDLGLFSILFSFFHSFSSPSHAAYPPVPRPINTMSYVRGASFSVLGKIGKMISSQENSLFQFIFLYLTFLSRQQGIMKWIKQVLALQWLTLNACPVFPLIFRGKTNGRSLKEGEIRLLSPETNFALSVYFHKLWFKKFVETLISL